MTPSIIDLQEIKMILEKIDVIKLIEEGFVAYSRGNVIVPPVGELIFEDPPGDCHIKYGYIKNNDYYVIKIASGFYDNPKIGLPSFDGLMLLFNQKTGELECILLDKGYLTNIRTAAAGAIVAKYLAPRSVKKIGVLGTGVQARLQVKYLKGIIDCINIVVWGRTEKNLQLYKQNMESIGYRVKVTSEIKYVSEKCQLIITCTPSKKPLLKALEIRKGTHITAMGSDTPNKQELESEILKKADIVVVDSIEQAKSRGECFQAMKNEQIKIEDLLELGNIITESSLQRTEDDQITIADLTGVAVQDIQIAKAVYRGFQTGNFSK